MCINTNMLMNDFSHIILMPELATNIMPHGMHTIDKTSEKRDLNEFLLYNMYWFATRCPALVCVL